MSFDTPIEQVEGGGRRGPARQPAQLLAEQSYDGGLSVHDDDNAARLGLAGAPIEGPTHFSQFDPLALDLFGSAWFERGCLSAHFQTMVVEGESVTAQLGPATPDGVARIDAWKADGTPVLTGSASLGRDGRTELDERRARQAARDVGQLYIVDQVADLVGAPFTEAVAVSVDVASTNGPLYPFSLAQKLDVITERSEWFDGPSPWGGAILPSEMLSVLAHQRGHDAPVRRPSLGLFIDLEVRYEHGPVLVGQAYDVRHRILQVGQSRSVESWWTESTITDPERDAQVATVLLHQGVFKASHPGHPDAAV
ncbi:MAG: hypothetical protein AAGG08_02775 [Actinomycetota bacterium]